MIENLYIIKCSQRNAGSSYLAKTLTDDPREKSLFIECDLQHFNQDLVWHGLLGYRFDTVAVINPPKSFEWRLMTMANVTRVIDLKKVKDRYKEI